MSGGVPNGVVLGAQTVDFSGSLPTTFRSISFSTPVPVTAGVPYALVLSTPGSCEIWPGPAGNPYLGGDAYFDAAPNPPVTWLHLGQFADLPFQTLVDAIAPDRTPPEARCVSKDNAAGFFQLLASDDVGVESIVVRDNASDFVSLPFRTGDEIKITQAPGATPSDNRPGPRATVSHLKLKGDAVLRVTDTSGNVTEVSCELAPWSK